MAKGFSMATGDAAGLPKDSVASFLQDTVVNPMPKAIININNTALFFFTVLLFWRLVAKVEKRNLILIGFVIGFEQFGVLF